MAVVGRKPGERVSACPATTTHNPEHYLFPVLRQMVLQGIATWVSQLLISCRIVYRHEVHATVPPPCGPLGARPLPSGETKHSHPENVNYEGARGLRTCRREDLSLQLSGITQPCDPFLCDKLCTPNNISRM